MKKRTIREIDVSGKRVFLRVDYNVAVDDEGMVEDDLRLRESLPTLRMLLDRGARLVICSHRGRPRGHVVEDLRNEPVARHLSKLLKMPVLAARDCVGPEVEAQAAALQPGDVLMLENVRFHEGEEANDDAFAKQLARLGDIFVNDAFGTAHRAHASIVGVPRYLPAVGGLLLEKEIRALSAVTEDPQHPFAIVLGGAKISDKLRILKNLAQKADLVCIGGGMANTFLWAQGHNVAESLTEPYMLEEAAELMRVAEKRGGPRILLPSDVVVADSLAADARIRTVRVESVQHGWRILDIGPETVVEFSNALRGMRTVVWNGPLGMFERPPFDQGSMAIARTLAGLEGATTVVGGGETAAAVKRAGLEEQVTHVSTGGGASLAMLEGKPLPGVEVLQDAEPEMAAPASPPARTATA